MSQTKESERFITERTENILGAVVTILGIACILFVIGYAVPNYYVYFNKTVNSVSVPVCNQ